MKEVDKAWLAAFIDGEGCLMIEKQRRIYCYSYSTRILVGQLDKQMIEHAKKVTGCGVIKYHRKGKLCVWRVSSKEAGKICKWMYPYLLIKRRQAECLITLQENSSKVARRATEGDYKERERLFILNKQLNQENKGVLK